MLLIFRLFFFAIGLAVLAVVLLARGLVPEPAFHTRIGEVPSVSRLLVQQAVIVPTEWERRLVTSASEQALEPVAAPEPTKWAKQGAAPEPTKTAEIGPPVPASARMPADTGADETGRTAYVSPVIWSRALRSDPLTELIRAVRVEAELTLPSHRIAGLAVRPGSGEPPALAFGVDEPTGEDGAGADPVGHGAEAPNLLPRRQAKAETGAEAIAETKAKAQAETKAKAAVAPRAKASKTKYRRKSVRRGRTKANKRRVAARSAVRSTRKKARRARSSQRERAKRRIRARQRQAHSTTATRTTRTLNRTYFRQPANVIYRFESPQRYRYYIVPQYRTNRSYTR